MDAILDALFPLVARASIVVAVVCALVAGVRGRRGTDPRAAISRSVAEALIVLGAIVIWGITLGPVDVLMPGVVAASPPVNLVPVQPVLSDIAAGVDWRETLANVVGNIVLFVPIGFGLRWRFGLRLGSILMIAIVASAAIEIGQALSVQMRSADVDDVLLNALGALAGAEAYIRVTEAAARRSP